MWHVCVSHYSLGSMIMSQRSLQIFSQEWGSKRNVWDENVAFWAKLHSFLHSWQCGVFSGTKVCVFFYQWGLWKVINHIFHQDNMCLWLLRNSVGKQKHTLPRYDLNFPFQNAVFLHWLFDGTAQNHLWALKCQKTNVEGAAALELPPGLMRPGPCDPVFWKNNLPASSFCCTYMYFPVSVLYWYCLWTV